MWSLEARSGPPRAPLATVFIFSLALLAGGCATTSASEERSAGPGVWDRTLQNVSTAIETTKNAITSTVRRIVREQREGWEKAQEEERRAKEAAAAKPEAPVVRAARPAPADRFPAERVASREQNVGRPEPPPARGPENRGLVLLPRIPQTPEQIRARMAEVDRVLRTERDPAERRRLVAERERLAQALKVSNEEETLIQEMEQLRNRLRELQNRLNALQSPRP